MEDKLEHYTEVRDKHIRKILFWFICVIVLLIPLKLIYNVNFFAVFVVVCIVFSFIYLLVDRKCEKCKKKMKLNSHDDAVIYYCVDCQTKITLRMQTGGQ